jgi:hypothetical protein
MHAGNLLHVVRWRNMLVAWTVLASAPLTTLAASPPIVTFSTSHMVVCRDVTPPEFAAANPWEKLIEATFQVSLLLDGDEADIDEVLVVFSSPQRRLRVADFLPRTESASDIVGPIERSESQESTRSLQAGLGGTVGAKYEIANAQISPSVSSGISEHDSLKENYKLLPPKKLLVASGTLQGDHGVFFKLKPSTQESLQGARPFSCIFIVPKEWRGDWLLISCMARGETKRQLLKKIDECGRGRFIAGLYLEGDPLARQLARKIDRLQSPPDASSFETLFNEPATAARGKPSLLEPGDAAVRPGFASLVQFYRQAWRLPFGPGVAAERAGEQSGSLGEACKALARLSGDAAALPPELVD